MGPGVHDHTSSTHPADGVHRYHPLALPPDCTHVDHGGDRVDIKTALQVLAVRGIEEDTWRRVAAAREAAVARGVDIRFADAVFARPRFGLDPGDPAAYLDRLTSCVNPATPPPQRRP